MPSPVLANRAHLHEAPEQAVVALHNAGLLADDVQHEDPFVLFDGAGALYQYWAGLRQKGAVWVLSVGASDSASISQSPALCRPAEKPRIITLSGRSSAAVQGSAWCIFKQWTTVPRMCLRQAHGWSSKTSGWRCPPTGAHCGSKAEAAHARARRAS